MITLIGPSSIKSYCKQIPISAYQGSTLPTVVPIAQAIAQAIGEAIAQAVGEAVVHIHHPVKHWLLRQMVDGWNGSADESSLALHVSQHRQDFGNIPYKPRPAHHSPVSGASRWSGTIVFLSALVGYIFYVTYVLVSVCCSLKHAAMRVVLLLKYSRQQRKRAPY